MLQQAQGSYEFGPFRLDSAQQQLFAGGHPVSLTPKAFSTLLVLVRNHGRLVSKEELLETVWPDAFVEESTLAQNVFRLRKLLENGDQVPYIETVPKRGYRFIAPVHEVVPQASEPRIAQPAPVDKTGSSTWTILAFGILAAAAIVALSWSFRSRHPLTDRDDIVLADFDNSTGDSMFDETLRQALMVQLEQTPFLNVLSRDRLSEELKLMRRTPDERLTPALAREVCQRSGSRILISGSIARLGSHFVIGVNAANCQTGDLLDSEQSEAESREVVLARLAQASLRLRKKLGESLASLQKYDTPVEQATTSSFEALKAYSEAVRLPAGPEVVPQLKRAILLDPNFAAAYSTLGGIYIDLGEYEAANTCYRKAYELRDRLTEREKLHATADYFADVVGDLDQANETYRMWQQAYPRDAIPHNDLAYDLELAGQYERELPEAVLANRNDPSLAAPYVHLMFAYAALNRLDDARRAYQQAADRHLDGYPYTHYMMYQVASVQQDAAEMERQLEWSKGKPGIEAWMLSFKSDVEAYHGHLRQARALSSQASQSVSKVEQPESAVLVRLNQAWRDAEFGNSQLARSAAQSALKELPSPGVRTLAALVLARAGDNVRAQSLVSDLERHSAGSVLLNEYWLPSIRAILDLNRNDPARALTDLQAASPFELGIPEPTVEEAAPFLPIYVRGQAYLLQHRGREAAAEFQKLLDYRGVTTNSPLAALANLQLARAFRLQGDAAGARTKYQEFLDLWKDADANIPVLAAARAEYSQSP